MIVSYEKGFERMGHPTKIMKKIRRMSIVAW